MAARLDLVNRSGYSTRDLRRFFLAGLHALGWRDPLRLYVVASPIRTRGCSQIGARGREGRTMTIAVASPSRFSLRRLARVFEHEVRHRQGLEHGHMDHRTLWSLGPVPRWAQGKRLRYVRRAPSQMP